MVAPLALLPMYDWAEVRAATDRLWDALRGALRAAGIGAPDALTRDSDFEAGWMAPELCLGQTCGLPFVRGLAGRVRLIGAPDYAVPGTLPGFYRSAVVVRTDAPGGSLASFRGAVLAVNDRGSQSGYAAILHHAAPLAEGGRFFGGWRETGSHAASVRAVADGAADIAAIDWVSWRLARRHLPAAARLRVLMGTDPTPGLPLIAAAGTDVEACRTAVARGIGGLDAAARDALGIMGFRAFDAADYAVVDARLAAALRQLPRDSAVKGRRAAPWGNARA